MIRSTALGKRFVLNRSSSIIIIIIISSSSILFSTSTAEMSKATENVTMIPKKDVTESLCTIGSKNDGEGKENLASTLKMAKEVINFVTIRAAIENFENLYLHHFKLNQAEINTGTNVYERFRELRRQKWMCILQLGYFQPQTSLVSNFQDVINLQARLEKANISGKNFSADIAEAQGLLSTAIYDYVLNPNGQGDVYANVFKDESVKRSIEVFMEAYNIRNNIFTRIESCIIGLEK